MIRQRPGLHSKVHKTHIQQKKKPLLKKRSKLTTKHKKSSLSTFSTTLSLFSTHQKSTTSTTINNKEDSDVNQSHHQEKQKQKQKVITLADFTPPPGCTQEQRATSLFRPSLYYVRKGVFSHPGFDENEVHKVQIHHFEPENFGDRVALQVINIMRKSFDLFSGYKHPPAGHENDPKYKMTREQILRRCVLLESVAAVPGLVGSMCRHLKSIRLLKRDLGWMELLIEESYNERMHLLSFLEFYKPGWFMKLAVLGAQGIMMNFVFVTYLAFPRIVHRGVGYLEEEAVVTYTRIIHEIEQGWHDDWANQPAPEIARAYWKMGENADFKTMIQYIRADESIHRSVNHTFGNLDQSTDPNPFLLEYDKASPMINPAVYNPVAQFSHPVGWKRDEIDVTTALHHDHPRYSEFLKNPEANQDNIQKM